MILSFFFLRYKLFLPKPCSRFWLNRTFGHHVPITFALKSKHKSVVKLLLQTIKDQDNFVGKIYIKGNEVEKELSGKVIMSKKTQIQLTKLTEKIQF